MRTSVWPSLLVCAAIGVALVLLYPDSYQQDAGHHFLFARFGWLHHEMFVGVWTRPLFTFLYSFPAAIGYPAAKLFTLAINLLTAYHTVRLAEQFKLPRAGFVVALLFLQPSFFLIVGDTMTEPIFGLLFVLAVRLHVAGRVGWGMAVASLMLLARPEGFYLGATWAAWVLVDSRQSRPLWQRLSMMPLLLIGAAIWWTAAYLITGDPLFIKHDWPANWGATARWYGVGPVWAYVARLPEIAGPFLAVPFLAGLYVSLRRRELVTMTTAFLTIFVLHSVLRTFGLFGSAGYARYFVCVSPAIAILTLAGWIELGRRCSNWSVVARRRVAAVTLVLSAVSCIAYTDMAGFYGRDARAVTEMHDWFRAHPRPIARHIWSQAYMDILIDRDPWEKPGFSSDKAANLAILKQSPAGTLVFWDGETGPAWFGMTADDIEAAGYERLRSKTYDLDGWLRIGSWWHAFRPRHQEMHLLYKN